MTTAWLVELEFERVQTYLFAVPELKSMVGANALLGEVLRGRLGPDGFTGDDNLPSLAVRCGAHLPGGVRVEDLPLPEADKQNDPLKGADRDSPRGAFRHGILARDGGHLHAVFRDEEAASEFVLQARALIGSKLAGLPLKARCLKLQKSDGAGWQRLSSADTVEGPGEAAFARVPQFQVCQATGQGPAAEISRFKNEPVRYLSESVILRREAARTFDRGESEDLLGLLRRALIAELGMANESKECQENLFPNEFTEVGKSGYLAVIAADGNGIGTRSNRWREQGESDFFVREARGEQFFHAMRVSVRRSLMDALVEIFQEVVKQKKTLPLRLLMLGGDDLLVVCDAPFALPFVETYVRRLQAWTMVDAPLHVGVGVAIVKNKFPFHRAHALAESLLASAKRRYRERSAEGSTVDWLAISEAWHDDIGAVRRRDAVHRYRQGADGRQETLVLSRKPYPVLGERFTLASFLAGARNAQGTLPRTQLMALAEGVGRGRLQAEQAVVRSCLGSALPDESPWASAGDGVWATALLDFLEVFELERLRKSDQSGDAVEGISHA